MRGNVVYVVMGTTRRGQLFGPIAVGENPNAALKGILAWARREELTHPQELMAVTWDAKRSIRLKSPPTVRVTVRPRTGAAGTTDYELEQQEEVT